MKIHFIIPTGSKENPFAGVTGIIHHRILLPALRMKLDGHDAHVIEYDKSVSYMRKYGTPDVMVFSIALYDQFGGMKKFRDFIKAHGIKVVVDIDDYYGKSEKVSDDMVYAVRKSVRFAHIVTVASPKLQEYYQQQGKKALLVDNAVNSYDNMWNTQKLHCNELWFGYVGASRHNKDVESMSYNFSDKNLVMGEWYEYFTKGCSLGFRDLTRYMGLYDYFHVSIAPLLNTKFNQYKSNLKIIEAGFKKKAIICSDVTPYTYDNELASKITTTDDFKASADEYTIERAEEEGEALYEAVKDKYEMGTTNNKRLEIYEELCRR